MKKSELTTKLTLIIIGLTAGSGLLIPATYASFHPVTTGEIADNTILSADIRNGEVRNSDIETSAVTSGKISDTAGVYSVDIVNGTVRSVDIGDGQVASADILDGTITSQDIASGSLPVVVRTVVDQKLGVRPGQYGQVIVPCPQGTLVTGGGFSTNLVDMKLTFNGPYQNGWYAAAYNGNAVRDGSVAAYALCLSHIR